jgi:superfamily II DNA or RNA helicase
MEHATFLHCGVSFNKKPRRGQLKAFSIVAGEPNRKTLTLKLPTGYGKTITAAGVYAILKKRGIVNRVLYITPRTAQHDAIIDDGILNFAAAGLAIAQPVDVSFYAAEALKKHRYAKAEAFAITIQSLAQRAGRELVGDLLAIGDWLVVVDEHHHVGDSKVWGTVIKNLRALPGCKFVLAMSATPDRPDEDGPFGEPDVNVFYREAANEGDIKPLRGYSYVYRLDATNDQGELFSMTTDELAEQAGGDDPDKIEKLIIHGKMRLLPKYISPLLSTPIGRLLIDRVTHGMPLQVLITCMSVSHAKLVYEQVRSMFPQLRFDWVGTGKYGRSDAENKEVLQNFCPKKEKNIFGEIEQPEPKLDGLIHVGIAGEGLDTRLVSEVVFLCPCNHTNTTFQIIGRGSRALKNAVGHAVVCHVSFDSSSDFSGSDKKETVRYIGSALMDAMDLAPPTIEEGDGDGDGDSDGDRDLPEIEDLILLAIALDHIDGGDEERIDHLPVESPPLADTARALEEVSGFDWWDQYLNDAELQEKVRTAYKKLVSAERVQQDERAQVTFWQGNVDSAVGSLAFRIAKKRSDGKGTFEKSLIGDLKKAMNQRKHRECGAVRADVELLKKHYQWCINLQTEIKMRGIPQWLL